MMSTENPTQDTYMILAMHKRQSNAGVGGLMALLSYGLFFLYSLYIIFLPNEWHSSTRGSLVHAAVAIFIGSTLGTVIGYYLVRKFRKKYIYVIVNALVLVAGCLIIPRWKSIAYVTVANYAAGIGYGIAMVTLTIHMPEVAMKKMRGAVVTVISLMAGTSFFAGSWLITISPTTESPALLNGTFGGLTLLYAAMGLAFLWCFTLESPVFLIQSNQEREALEVLKRARLETRDTYEIFHDFEELKELINDEKDDAINRLNSKSFRYFIHMLTLRLNYAVSSSLLLIAFQYIFSLELSDQFGLGIVFIPRFIVEMLAMYWVEKFGRKKCLLISLIFCGTISIISSIILSTSALPDQFLILALFAIAYHGFVGLGLSPVSLIYLTELFPLKRKAASVAIIFAAENVLQIILVILGVYVPINIKGFMVTIGAIHIFCGIYFYRSMPETQGLSLLECLRKIR